MLSTLPSRSIHRMTGVTATPWTIPEKRMIRETGAHQRHDHDEFQ
jgi:hypothetical protein